MTSNQPVILLAEDDANDVFFLRRAFTKAGVDCSIQVVSNGQEVMDYFNGVEKFSDRGEFPLPSLLLLDLKMPFVNGFDVLAWMQTQGELSKIPVVVLTSSAEDRDRDQATKLGAKGYCVKPPTREMILKIMTCVEGWTEKVALPA